MKKKICKWFTLFSLLLAAGIGWWWSSSGGRIDQVAFEKAGSQTIRLWGSDGKFMLTRVVYPATGNTPGCSGALRWSSMPKAAAIAAEKQKQQVEQHASGNSFVMAAAFTYASQPIPEKNGGGMETTLVLPAWLLVAFFSLAPLMWVAKKLKPKNGGKKPAAA